MPDNKWVTYGMPAATAALGAYSAYVGSKNARQAREDVREENEIDRRYNAAVAESAQNPFRHQLDQARTLGTLDVMANAQLTPAKYTMPGITVPQLSGGFSYTPSQDQRTAAQLLQRSVASGQTAPSMTDPNNWGKTGALNLNGMATTGGAPTSGARPRASTTGAPGVSAASNGDIASLFAGYQRRNEGAGGVMKGAATGAAMGAKAGWMGAAGGAIVGGLVGAATKNAKSAMTDFSVQDARTIIGDAYRQYLGRDATSAEIQESLRGVGFKAEKGHKWVGEQGLSAIVRAIQQAGSRQADAAPASAAYAGLFA